MTVKECVLKILKSEPHQSNQVIADKVRQELKSNTTAANISWYKSNLKQKEESSKIRTFVVKRNKGIEKYKECFITGTESSVCSLLGAEARNIVQTLYKGKKKGMKCEYNNCKSHDKELHACHFGKERKEILEDAMRKSKTSKGYDVYKIFEIYKKEHLHAPDSIIRLLCGKHHKMLDENKTPEGKKKFVQAHLIKK